MVRNLHEFMDSMLLSNSLRGIFVLLSIHRGFVLAMPIKGLLNGESKTIVQNCTIHVFRRYPFLLVHSHALIILNFDWKSRNFIHQIPDSPSQRL